MKRIFLNAKLHQARITHAELEYEGSFSIDQEILELSGIREYEQVHVLNIDNGHRFITYAIEAPPKSKIMGANGACARLVEIGHRVIICTYAELSDKDMLNHKPTVLLLDEHNHYRVLGSGLP